MKYIEDVVTETGNGKNKSINCCICLCEIFFFVNLCEFFVLKGLFLYCGVIVKGVFIYHIKLINSVFYPYWLYVVPSAIFGYYCVFSPPRNIGAAFQDLLIIGLFVLSIYTFSLVSICIGNTYSINSWFIKTKKFIFFCLEV